MERVKTLLGDRVKEVRLTHRLTDTPAIVTTDADEMSTQMAKLFAAAGPVRAGSEENTSLSSIRIMCWLNALPIPRMKRSLKWVELLLDQALFAERGTLERSEPVYPPYEPVAGVLITLI